MSDEKRVRPYVPRRAVPPTGGALILGDGRRLIYLGQRSFTDGGITQVTENWKTSDGMGVMCSLDDTEKHGKLLHVSVSYGDHLPSWDDVKLVRACFFPAEIDAMMVLPQVGDYVNLHPYTFHLWQTPVEWGIM